MIIYIHGFGSCGLSSKATILKSELKEFGGFISPSLSCIPDLAIDTLEQIISTYIKYEKVYLIGTSLGGYYAIYLANKFNIPAILVNPVVNAPDTLNPYFTQATNYYDNSKFEWNEKHIQQLTKYRVKCIKGKLYMLLVQKGDVLLNYKEAVELFKDSKIFIEDNGSHRFDNIENHIKNMINFYQCKKM